MNHQDEKTILSICRSIRAYHTSNHGNKHAVIFKLDFNQRVNVLRTGVEFNDIILNLGITEFRFMELLSYYEKDDAYIVYFVNSEEDVNLLRLTLPNIIYSNSIKNISLVPLI